MDPGTNPLRSDGLDPGAAERHLQMVQWEAGNFELVAYPGLIIKESYWRLPERNLEGNAIDFFVHVLGMSFHEAMRAIVETS